MGAHGTYGRMRTVGPVAAAFGGQGDMSGLPEPAMPVGWGYSYLDWMGAYSYALALLGALYHRERTGEGQWIDASQCEVGMFLTGATILDWSANEREWRRYGNRSPYKPAAPHGAYRCAGTDRWIAIACFTDAEWRALAQVAGHGAWLEDRRFDTLAHRLAHQDALDALVEAWTRTQDAYDCMMALQRAGVPAGVCQNAEDRCDHDPQLRHLKWLTEVTGTKIGTWPVYELPMKFSAHAGLYRRPDRSRRAVLRRGQRVAADRAAGDEQLGRRAAGGRGRDLIASVIARTRSDEAICWRLLARYAPRYDRKLTS